jgi:hypothetical protein
MPSDKLQTADSTEQYAHYKSSNKNKYANHQQNKNPYIIASISVDVIS